MRRVRGGSGLGDAIYVRAICDHLIAAGESVEACSAYEDVFIGSGAKVSPFRRDKIDVLAHYSARKARTDTTQWEDVCGTAGIGAAPLRINWQTQNHRLIERVKKEADGRKIIIVHGGRPPMGRTDGFGAELLPERSAFDAVVSELRDCFLVRVGSREQSYRIWSHLDLCGFTSVSDLLDLVQFCDGVVAQCSFAVPLAEVFDRPLLAIWSARGLASGQQYVKTITPAKILSKPTSNHVVDDWPVEKIKEAARAFRDI